MSKKRIIITGATSLLMQRFISLLDKNIYEVTGISRHLQKDTSISWIMGDLNDLTFISSLCKNQDIIIHAAGTTHSFEEKPYNDINYEATKKIIDSAVENNLEKFVFISSRTAVPNSGAYGLSKLKAENYLKCHFRNWLIFRPSEIFGGDKKEGIDQLIDDVFKKKTIFYPSGVESKLAPIHINDAVNFIYSKINNKNETIFVTGNKEYTYKEFICLTAYLLNKTIITIPIPKFLMYAVKTLIQTLKIRLSITPDQIPRLYCHKEIGNENTEIKFSLESHLKTLFN